MMGPIKPSEIKSIAPLPLSVVRLAEMVANPDSAVGDFVRVIEYDPALTANVLRWANSAWSQASTPMTDVRSSVIRLGGENVLKLAIGYHLISPMKKSNNGYQLSENELWRHSVTAALAAEEIKKRSPGVVPNSAFTASLMHDLGKIILGRHLGTETLKTAILKSMEEGATYIDAERQIMGTDHAEIGALIAREWKIPESLAEAIEFHHQPQGKSSPVLDVVHVSNAIAKLVGEGLGIEELNMTVSSQAAENLSLNSLDIQKICVVVSEGLHDTLNQWEMH